MSIQSSVQTPPVVKPWWKSTTVLFAALAGGCVAVDGFLQSTVGVSLAASLGATDYVSSAEMILEGVAFLASGGAIRGRFLARLPLK